MAALANPRRGEELHTMTSITTCRAWSAAFMPGHDALHHQGEQEFERTLEAIRAGAWRTSGAYQAALAEPHRCHNCGRPLRLIRRKLCGCCLGVHSQRP
jgi:hypothetical protein